MKEAYDEWAEFVAATKDSDKDAVYQSMAALKDGIDSLSNLARTYEDALIGLARKYPHLEAEIAELCPALAKWFKEVREIKDGD